MKSINQPTVLIDTEIILSQIIVFSKGKGLCSYFPKSVWGSILQTLLHREPILCMLIQKQVPYSKWGLLPGKYG